MELFANLATGFGAAVTPVNLGFCLFGCLIGTLIGVLPGIGPIATIAMLLPVTFGLSPLGALIMLAGIYYGAQYGGSTTAILVNLPGESSSVVKAVGMVILGLLVGLVGTESQSATARFTFGVPELYDGVDFVPLAMGLFGLAEILSNLDRRRDQRIAATAISSLWPSNEEIRRAAPAVVRGAMIGALLGILPGGGAVLASFAAYTLEKKTSRFSAEFGKGAVEGVAAPEAANNAGAQTSFIPLLTLGIPSNPVMALMMGAMLIQGIAPGTAIISDRPELFWGMVASMWVGNLMLIVINLPLIGIWVRLLRVPYRLLFPCIVVLCCVGAYSVNSSTFLILMMAGFALLGYIFAKLGCEGAPFLRGFVLGPLMEENFRRSMVLSFGDPTIFLRRPISLCILLAGLALIALIIIPQFRTRRDEAFQE